MPAELPAHIDLSVPAFAVGSGLTVIVTLSNAMHPLLLMESRTMYMVVVPGVTVLVALVDEYPEGDEVHL